MGVPDQFKGRFRTRFYRTFEKYRMAKSPVRKRLVSYKNRLTGRSLRGT